MSASDPVARDTPLFCDASLQQLQQVMDAFAASSCQELSFAANGTEITLTRAAQSAATALTLPVSEAAGVSHVVEAASHGIFYATPSEDAPPFVVPGQSFASGDQLGLMEAMKVFTPVYAECSGVAGDYLVANGTVVAPGTALLEYRS